MPPKKPKRKAGEKTGSNLVRQPHGGAIHQGAPDRIVPGPGRPPSAVRAACREEFEKRIPVLCLIADDQDAPYEQRRLAVDSLGKHGLSGTISADDVRERLKATLQEVRSALPADQAEMLISRIKPHWMAA